MPASAARVSANRTNSLKSTGPKTPEGKAVSRANGIKHGLTGSGVVLLDADCDEVEIRNETLQAELDPKSCLGGIMVRQLATLSVRMERGAKQESSCLASRVRHAAEEYDEARILDVQDLIDTLDDDPRGYLRKLRKSPEGIELLIGAWEDLRADLARTPRPLWNPASQARAENLSGYRADTEPGLRIKTLSDAIQGDFRNLAAHEGETLSNDDRRAWAIARMLERIDAAIAELETHYESLDFAAIGRDRAEAGDRALFDPSHEAALARRYESEARRGFFQALKQFRQAEAEFADRVEAAEIEESTEPLASSWERESRSRSSEPRQPEIVPATPRPTSATGSNSDRSFEATVKTLARCPTDQS